MFFTLNVKAFMVIGIGLILGARFDARYYVQDPLLHEQWLFLAFVPFILTKEKLFSPVLHFWKKNKSHFSPGFTTSLLDELVREIVRGRFEFNFARAALKHKHNGCFIFTQIIALCFKQVSLQPGEA